MEQSRSTAHPLVEVIERLIVDTNRMWASGTIPTESSVRLVTDDLTAVQYAPHYEDGVWRAGSGAEWVESTAEAAAALRGRGCAWSVEDVHVLGRDDDEAIVSYRVVHEWGSSDRPPAQAFFLETWRRGDDGVWRLARHTAEKV